jgi:hypothetical protein
MRIPRDEFGYFVAIFNSFKVSFGNYSKNGNIELEAILRLNI